MRFLVDECTGPVVAEWLRFQQHDVFSIYEQARGLEDVAILKQAWDEERILITCDKDFGELVFREGLLHKGIILLRLSKPEPASRIAALKRLLDAHADQLSDAFVVATESAIRIVSPPRTARNGLATP